MVDFAQKRLQVFVSSTHSDLLNERQAAVEAILAAGHIPAGMELFTAGDESQMAVIRQWIDASDAFLIILGGRYGSIEATSGKSYTQIEYEYATRKRKPVFACVISEPALAERLKVLGSAFLETAHPDRYSTFRALVMSKIVRFWDDSKDIKVAIGETLSVLSRRSELVGWIRAADYPRFGVMPASDEGHAPLSWLYDASALLELEAVSGGSEIWIASPHLVNDTGTVYEVYSDKPGAPSTIETVQENLRRQVNYTFIVPDIESIRVRLPQLRRNYSKYPGHLRIVTVKSSVFERVTWSEMAIYNPLLEDRRPPRVFIELPVRTMHRFWAEMAEEIAYSVVARVADVISHATEDTGD